MFWSLLSIAMCASLVVRLLFWTDDHRRESRWYYRVLLFLVTVYAASNVVDFLYHPTAPVSPWLAMLHTGLLFGAFIIRPQYLPWNGHYASEARSTAPDTFSRLRFGLRRPGVYGRQARPGSGKLGTVQGSQRIR